MHLPAHVSKLAARRLDPLLVVLPLLPVVEPAELGIVPRLSAPYPELKEFPVLRPFELESPGELVL